MEHRNQPLRRHRVRPTHLVLGLLAILVFAACGNALVATEPGAATEAQLSLDLDARAKKSLGFVGDGAAVPMALPPDAVVFGDELAQDGKRNEAESSAVSSNAGDDALIARTANLELEVDDVAAVLLDARAEMTALGGYVAGSDEYDQGDRRWASVVYRVPVDRFTAALDALRGLSARVVRESTQSQEVTATVVDLDARINNLRASEEALVEIMDRSGRIEDVLAVQTRLEDVRGRIERLEAQRNNLSDQAALSTLSVTWFTPVAAVTVAQEGWSLATEIDAALAQTVAGVQRIASLGVWFAVVVLPLLAIPALIVLALFLGLRRKLRDGAGGDPDGPEVTATPAE